MIRVVRIFYLQDQFASLNCSYNSNLYTLIFEITAAAALPILWHNICKIFTQTHISIIRQRKKERRLHSTWTYFRRICYNLNVIAEHKFQGLYCSHEHVFIMHCLLFMKENKALQNSWYFNNMKTFYLNSFENKIFSIKCYKHLCIYVIMMSL